MEEKVKKKRKTINDIQHPQNSIHLPISKANTHNQLPFCCRMCFSCHDLELNLFQQHQRRLKEFPFSGGSFVFSFSESTPCRLRNQKKEKKKASRDLRAKGSVIFGVCWFRSLAFRRLRFLFHFLGLFV